jgi:hypothetical protein
MASQSLGTLAVPVTVNDGVPTPNPVTINSTGTVQFQNLDSTDYLIELWAHGNALHAAVCVFLPANGNVTLQADPANPNAQCHYNLMTTNGRGTNPGAGGGNVIIIGSGADD